MKVLNNIKIFQGNMADNNRVLIKNSALVEAFNNGEFEHKPVFKMDYDNCYNEGNPVIGYTVNPYVNGEDIYGDVELFSEQAVSEFANYGISVEECDFIDDVCVVKKFKLMEISLK